MMQSSPHWDRLHTLVGIFLSVEKWFDITISDDEADGVQSIEDLVSLITKKLKEKSVDGK